MSDPSATIAPIDQALDHLFTTMERRKEEQRLTRQQAEDRKLERLTRRKPLWWQDKDQ